MFKMIKTIIFVAIFYVLFLGIDHIRQPAVNPAFNTVVNSQILQAPVIVNNKSAHSNDDIELVYFWGTWCGVCSITSPAISELSKNYKVTGVALSSGDDTKVREFINSKQYNFAVVNDSNGDISRQLEVYAVPTILIVKNGEIVHRTGGFTSEVGLKMQLWLFSNIL